jgi:hypothetical protein
MGSRYSLLQGFFRYVVSGVSFAVPGLHQILPFLVTANSALNKTKLLSWVMIPDEMKM